MEIEPVLEFFENLFTAFVVLVPWPLQIFVAVVFLIIALRIWWNGYVFYQRAKALRYGRVNW